MNSKIETYERDLEAQKKILDVVSLYQAKTVLPMFKKEKLELYKAIVQQFNVIEISNCHQSASFWAQILKRPIV